MKKLDLEKLLLNIFKEDKLRNNKNTVFSQLTMITIKSLMPSPEFVGNTIDYRRFKEELDLLSFYKIDNRPSFLENIGEDSYYKYKDETIYSRILPIIIANMDYKIVEEETIKNIIYTTGDIETLLEWLALSKIIFMMISQEENILEEVKEYIINISQTEFLDKYKNQYLYEIVNKNINYEVDFERARITMISLFHGVDMGKYIYVKDMLGVLNGKKPKTHIGEIIENHKSLEDGLEIMDKNYRNMAVYILKLRKSRIDPDNLKINEYILPDIFSFKEDEEFFHSLLNNSKVIKKEVKDGSLTSLIQTRTGMYLFKRPFQLR